MTDKRDESETPQPVDSTAADAGLSQGRAEGTNEATGEAGRTLAQQADDHFRETERLIDVAMDVLSESEEIDSKNGTWEALVAAQAVTEAIMGAAKLIVAALGARQ